MELGFEHAVTVILDQPSLKVRQVAKEGEPVGRLPAPGVPVLLAAVPHEVT